MDDKDPRRMVNIANGKARDPQNPEKHLKIQGGGIPRRIHLWKMEYTIIRYHPLNRKGTLLCRIGSQESAFDQIVGAIGHPSPGSEPHFKLANKQSVAAAEMLEIAGWMQTQQTATP
jgi:hypothetical protein